jgi:hypothetical protein
VWKRKGTYGALVWKPEERFERPMLTWEDNIDMDFYKIGWEGMDWIHLDQDRHRWLALLYVVINFGFHKEQ